MTAPLPPGREQEIRERLERVGGEPHPDHAPPVGEKEHDCRDHYAQPPECPDHAPPVGEEHRCGPTPEQVNDARMRGETLGTWDRCEECAAEEARLLEGVEFIEAKDMGPVTYETIPAPPADRAVEAMRQYVEAVVQGAMDDWRRACDLADDGSTMAEAVVDRLYSELSGPHGREVAEGLGMGFVAWWDDKTPLQPGASHRAVRLDRFDDYYDEPLFRLPRKEEG